MTSSKFVISFLTIATYAVALAQSAPTPAKPVAPTGGASQAAAPNAPSTPAESNVPADAPVITINGVCDVSPNGQAKPAPQAKAAAGSAPSAARPDCKTQITRAEFEKLLKTVASGAPAATIRSMSSRIPASGCLAT